MTTVTGYTAAKQEELADEQIIDGELSGDNLHLITRGGIVIDVGSVRGPAGSAGGAAATVCTSGTRPATPAAGQVIYETDTYRTMVFAGGFWTVVGPTWTCTSGTRPSSPWVGLFIFETDTLREYYWAGSVWVQTAGAGAWVAPTLLNSWVNRGGAIQTARYSKVNGIVAIEGGIKDGSASSVAFTLPSGFRPAADLTLPSTYAGDLCSAAILANGDVYPCISTWPGAVAGFNINFVFRASA